jgi:bis(5'-nucleosidyl)-tetraphosphatase
VPAEHSAGAVIFRKEDDKLIYLLLHYEEGHWGFAKGHIEKGEKIADTARREIREETGITDIRFIEGFRGYNKYFYSAKDQKILKTVTFWLANTPVKEVRLSREHVGYEWLPYTGAVEKITFQDEKKLLTRAHKYILKQIQNKK